MLRGLLHQPYDCPYSPRARTHSNAHSAHPTTINMGSPLPCGHALINIINANSQIGLLLLFPYVLLIIAGIPRWVGSLVISLPTTQCAPHLLKRACVAACCFLGQHQYFHFLWLVPNLSIMSSSLFLFSFHLIISISPALTPRRFDQSYWHCHVLLPTMCCFAPP